MTDQQPRFAPQSPRHKWDIENCPRPCSSSPVVVEEEERRHGEPHRARYCMEKGRSLRPPPLPDPGRLFFPLSPTSLSTSTSLRCRPLIRTKHPATVGTD